MDFLALRASTLSVVRVPVPVPVHALLFSLPFLIACVPDLDSDESTVREPRVIAIQAEPAEATANQTVTYRALLVDPQGERTSGVLAWFYCTAPKPLAELGPVNKECLDPASKRIQLIGRGASVMGDVPREVCELFGPNPPAPVDDQPPGRPVDPDDTGGYKAPVVLGVNAGNGENVLLYEERVSCGLAGASPDVTVDFVRRYHVNQNPSVVAIRATIAGQAEQTLAGGDTFETQPGASVRLAVEWPSCPESDVCGDEVCGPDETVESCEADCRPLKGCGGQERYVWYDRESRTLKTRRESMRVAWFATSGTYDDERSGLNETEAGTASENTWTAPSAAGEHTLWVVLRDARGGVGFADVKVRVR